MIYIGGLPDWEWSDCGAQGCVEYDDFNKEYYKSLPNRIHTKLFMRTPMAMNRIVARLAAARIQVA